MVLTLDLDFGEILALGVVDTPSVVIFRLMDERAVAVNRRLDVVLAERCLGARRRCTLPCASATDYQIDCVESAAFDDAVMSHADARTHSLGPVLRARKS